MKPSLPLPANLFASKNRSCNPLIPSSLLTLVASASKVTLKGQPLELEEASCYHDSQKHRSGQSLQVNDGLGSHSQQSQRCFFSKSSPRKNRPWELNGLSMETSTKYTRQEIKIKRMLNKAAPSASATPWILASSRKFTSKIGSSLGVMSKINNPTTIKLDSFFCNEDWDIAFDTQTLPAL